MNESVSATAIFLFNTQPLLPSWEKHRTYSSVQIPLLLPFTYRRCSRRSTDASSESIIQTYELNACLRSVMVMMAGAAEHMAVNRKLCRKQIRQKKEDWRVWGKWREMGLKGWRGVAIMESSSHRPENERGTPHPLFPKQSCSRTDDVEQQPIKSESSRAVPYFPVWLCQKYR